MTDSMIVADAKSQLRNDGWQADEMSAPGADDLPWWYVTVVKAECCAQGDGATRDEAWLCTVERARPLGLLKRSSER